MFARQQWVLYILLFLVLPVSAQNGFITLDWQELPAVQTLPTVTETLPLPSDFRSRAYQVNIEFPELEPLAREAVSELSKQGISLPESPKLETSVRVSAHQGFLQVSFIPVICRDGQYQRIRSFKLSLTSSGVATRSSVGVAASTTTNSVLSSGRFVKIRVSGTGVYRITTAELSKMGFTRPDKVRLYGYGGYLLSQEFALHPADDLPEVPLYRKANALLFYARGTVSWKVNGAHTAFSRIQNFYSNYSYYFLTEKEEAPAEFSVIPSLTIKEQPIDVFNEYALHEQDAYSWSTTGRELYDSYNYANGNSQKYSFTLPGITDGDGWVEASFTAKYLVAIPIGAPTPVGTSIDVTVNGTSEGTQTISPINNSNSYTKATEGVVNKVWKGAKTESTVVTVTHSRPAGVPGRLNYIALNYQRRLHLDGSYLAFRSLASVNKASTFTLSGASASTVVWDVTVPAAYKRIEGTLVDGVFTFTIPAGALREFVAVNTEGSFSSVEVVGEVGNQNLHALSGIDMVIIVPQKAFLLTQAERLAKAHRDHDGLSVQIVTAPQVYNEFSSGTPDVTAYRRLMKMLYDRSSSDADRPKYLLLFGDCSYDNRMISIGWEKRRPDDYLLCYQSERSLEETNSYVTDDYLGFLDDNEGLYLAADLLDIGIGRFPVTTETEAKATVDKTIAYMENKQAGPWKQNLCFVADNGDAKEHLTNADKLATYMQKEHPSFLINRIYSDSYRREATATGHSYPEAHKRILQSFDEGMLIINYTGHGSTTAWSADKLLTASDIVKFSSPRLPLWITATCDFTRFDHSETSAGELAFFNPKGGAIALFTTSRVVYGSQNLKLNQAFNKYLLATVDGKRLRLGDIMRLAKCELETDVNKLNFSLIGDPALTLAYPDYQVAVDEFDGPLTDEYPYAKAGGKITVKGRVLTPDGSLAEEFKGTVHPTVFDSEETMHTLDNLGEGALTYIARTKVLFAGSDSVRQGRFEFTFPVPLDINYSDQSGMLNLYARSHSNNEAHGSFDRFLVGGTDDNLSQGDMQGPRMNLYLNTPDFVWGGQTNETPFFIAELEDVDGINTVGNGIGHDLSLLIDGKTTYSLNDSYTPQPGDYGRGTVRFSLPTLPEGKHTLRFRAWDMLNHSSTQSLEFEVVNGLRPDLFQLICTKSPARENTTFVLSHNRPGTELAVRIAVCDFSGRELWVHTEQGVSADRYYYIDWNLCSNAGQRLSPGVYLYRASITSGESKESTKTEKIVILAQ